MHLICHIPDITTITSNSTLKKWFDIFVFKHTSCFWQHRKFLIKNATRQNMFLRIWYMEITIVIFVVFLIWWEISIVLVGGLLIILFYVEIIIKIRQIRIMVSHCNHYYIKKFPRAVSEHKYIYLFRDTEKVWQFYRASEIVLFFVWVQDYLYKK